MNYIKEINAFYQRQETNQLSSGAANLWHTLMHVNNRAGWIETFTVAASVLCSKASLTNSTFKRARIELRDKGYIYYESQGGNRAARYKIVSLEQSTMSHSKDHNEYPSDQHFEPETKEQSKLQSTLDHKAVPLLKLNETKQRTTTAVAEAIDFFRENIGDIQPYIKSDLIKWTNVIGEPLVLAAMKRALERGKGNWGYIKGILQDWSDKGFTLVEETESEVAQFRTKRNKKYLGQEVVPDWFHERKKPGEKREQKIETVAEVRERKELGELIAGFASG